MKKFLCLSLMVILIVAFAACGGKSNPPAVSGEKDSGLPDTIPDNIQTPGSSDVPDEESLQQEQSEGRVLIAYFSQARIVSEGADAISSATPYVGNTASAAYEIQKIVGGDVFEIVTINAYPVDHREGSEIAERELKEDVRPELSTHVEDMDAYDVIFLGYPIWWYTEPMAIRTFLEEYDFSGKTIVPFCTSLGAGISESIKDISGLCPDSTILDGLTLRTGREDMSGDITEWLAKIGMFE